MQLNDYMQKFIFEPLGLKDISMFPTASMKKRLVHMHHRDSNGKLSLRDHLHRRVLAAEDDSSQKQILHSGGAGLFATTADYSSKLIMHSLTPRLMGTNTARNHLCPPERRQMPPYWRDNPQ